jgi:hypothetical protein
VENSPELIQEIKALRKVLERLDSKIPHFAKAFSVNDIGQKIKADRKDRDAELSNLYQLLTQPENVNE